MRLKDEVILLTGAAAANPGKLMGFGDAAALVPARQQQPRVVNAVVVVQMRKELVRHVNGLMTGFEEAVVGAATVIEEQQVVTNFDHVAALIRSRERLGVPVPSSVTFICNVPRFSARTAPARHAR
jgi:hypothetical protein